MATLFTVNYSADYGYLYDFKAEAWESEVDYANNRSKVNVDVYMRRNKLSSQSAYNGYGTEWGITIDGTFTSGVTKWDTRNTTDWIWLGYASKVVDHNTDGSRWVDISAYHVGNSATGSSKMGEAHGSGGFWLTHIPRYTTVTASQRGRTSSSISVNWSTTDARDWTQYSLNGGAYQDAYDTVASDQKSGYFTIGNLSPNTEYKVKVSCRRTDSGLWSESNEITIKTFQKTTPTISVASKTSTSVNVSSSVNVTTSSVKYRIKKSGGTYGSYQTGTSFTGLSPNTAYVVEVSAVGKDSGETGTATVNVTTYQKTTPTISLSSKTSSSITVTSSTNVTTSSVQYRIKTSSGSYGNYQTSATFSGLAANTAYVIEVKSVGKDSGEAGTATLSVTTYQKTIPTISLSKKTSTSITVTSSVNVTTSSVQYRIKKSDGSYGNYQTSATFSGLSANTAYVVEVKAVGKDSGESATATVSVTTYQTTIASISLASKTSTSITVSSSVNVTTSSVKYRIKQGTGSYGDYQTGTTFSSLSPNTSYTIEVYAVGKDSGESDTATVTVTTYQKTIPTIALSSKTSTSITVSSSVNVTTSSVQYRIKTSSGSYGSYQTSATFSSLTPNTAYVIEVKAVGKDSGESATATVSVTTYQKTIPTISLDSKTINSIVVKSSANVTVSSTQYRIKTSSGSYGSYQTSATFSNLTQATAYVIEVKVVGKDSGESGTATLNVTTYDIAKLTSTPAFNLGDTLTVGYSNPSSSKIEVGLYTEDASKALAAYRTASGTSYKFTFTDAELDAIYKQFGSSNKLNVKVYIRTTCNSKVYYNSVIIVATNTGNQKTGHVNINGTWKRSKRWINVNGTWRRCIRWINVNGTWKKTI